MANRAGVDPDDYLVSTTLRRFFNLGRVRIRKFEEERFFNLVDDSGDCWIFTGGTANRGYGQFVLDDRRTVKAHRWSWEFFRGPIPDGLVLDHLCRNRSCVNPDHLDPVTVEVNNARGVGVAAINAQKRQCDKGHEFTAENTYKYPDGRRECRACSREYKRRWREKFVGKSHEN